MPQSWERREDETELAYRAFCTYRDMGPGRTVLRVWRLTPGKEAANAAPGKLTGWASLHDWSDRVKEYDTYTEQAERKKREKEHSKELASYRKDILETSRLATEAGMLALRKSVVGLKSMDWDGVHPNAVANMLRAAAAVLDSAFNQRAEAIGVRRLEALLAKDQPEDTEPQSPVNHADETPQPGQPLGR